MPEVDIQTWADDTASGPLRRNAGEVRCVHSASLEPAHLALFYAGDAEYVGGVSGFLAPGVEAEEPIAVAVPAPRAELLRRELGERTASIEFLDMLELGRNPARIIPAVLTMLERHRGRTLHYVGEPVWPGRSREEVQEATRHEALINLAWPGAAIRVLCPYDARRLDDGVLSDAEKTHPWVLRDGAAVRSGVYGGATFPAGTDDPLPPPPADAVTMPFGMEDLAAVRAVVNARATVCGLHRDAIDDFIIAVNEVATNAIKYGDAGGALSIWCARGGVVCQIEDGGHMTDPLAGRHRPIAGTDGGIGLWMVNQLCDLVEVRTTPRGTTIRLHAGRGKL